MEETKLKMEIQGREYLPPSLEIIYLKVEQGFAQSYGESGKAGGNFSSGGEWDI